MGKVKQLWEDKLEAEIIEPEITGPANPDYVGYPGEPKQTTEGVKEDGRSEDVPF